MGYIVGVDVMHCLHAEMGQREFPSLCKGGEGFGVEVALRVDRIPSRPHEVAWMENRGRKMPGWVFVEADVIRDEESLDDWVERSLTFVTTLPPK